MKTAMEFKKYLSIEKLRDWRFERRPLSEHFPVKAKWSAGCGWKICMDWVFKRFSFLEINEVIPFVDCKWF